MTSLHVNGKRHEVSAAPDEPLFYVLTDELGLKGPRFGCGLAQCGSCSVLVDGVETRSCVTPVGAVAGRHVTTLEGLQGHPVQEALVEVQAPQCGYCMNGMVVKSAELLAANAAPSEAEVREALNGHLCRCGTYPRIIEAVLKAAQRLAGQRKP
jgi:aerobic-type carbon monoxide dehydrogenase small subunit (CoxS/CutS family)